ncbi:MAG: TonB-dependent receptor [Pseudomonadota bacterium]|uniref:TonB-dependent receptor n=1 Tax=Rhizorhabdus phycosphaerae TaxID=2711156 RepID=UPI0013EDD02D|nr:TonB-dependent receptor [Rhizorhabdus phycosphaerae]
MKGSGLLMGVSSAAIGCMICASPVSAAAADNAVVDEGFAPIIVTANRRAENVQNVAVPVTALNAALIEQRFSRDLLDLGSIAPNLIVDPILGNGTAAISIRGIQLNDVEKSFDPPVGVFLDGVYLASTTGALLTVYDAATVEVLRGPQGTLFGRNTIGGLLHVQRARPTGEWGGKISATYGRFEQFDVKGVLNLPQLGNAISAKVAFVSLNGGGYFRNVTRNKREGNNDLLMISPQVLVELGGGNEINLAYDYIRDRTPTRPVTALTEANELFGTLPGGIGLGQPAGNAGFHRRPTTSLDQKAFLDTHSITANGKFGLADDHDLFVVVNYRDTKENSIQDFDGVAATLFNSERPQQIDQFSAELRYQGTIGRAKVVSGLYFFDSKYNLNQRTYFFGAETGGTDYQQKAKSYAAFAQVDWEAIDNLTFTAGGRYLVDKKRACGGLGQGPVSARTYLVSYGDCSETRQNAPGFSNVIPGSTSLATGRATWKKFTPKVGVSYKPGEDVLLYASYSEGFRSGGFNGRGNNILTLGPYNPEKVRNFEVGLKSEFLDRRVQVNISAFHTKYLDKQEDVVFPDPAGATVTVVQNAASATLKGFELESKFRPIAGLTLGFNLGYLESGYGQYFDQGTLLDGPNAGQLAPIDKSNFLLRRAPKWNGELNMNYELPIGDKRSLLFNTDYNFKSRYSIVGNTVNTHANNPGIIKAFGTLNGSISYKTETYKVSLFGRNLTGEDHFLHVLDVGTTFGRTAASNVPIPTFALWTFGTINPPTTYGIEIEFKF